MNCNNFSVIGIMDSTKNRSRPYREKDENNNFLEGKN